MILPDEHYLGDDNMMDTFVKYGDRERDRVMRLGIGVGPYIAMADDADDEVGYGGGHEDGYGAATAYLTMQDGTAPGVMMPPITDSAYAVNVERERNRDRWALMTAKLTGMVDDEIGASATYMQMSETRLMAYL